MSMKLFICCFFLFIVSCQSLPDNRISAAFTQGTTASFTGALSASVSDEESSNPAELRPVLSIPRASAILNKKQVPILCYHQIRDWKPTDSKISRDYIVPPDRKS